MLSDKKRRLRSQRQLVDLTLSKIQSLNITRPKKGWIKTIRESLGMSISQLAKRSNLDQSTVTRLEINEAQSTITLKSLMKLAESLECELVYAIVPKNKSSLSKIISERAKKVLLRESKIAEKTMSLEGQGGSLIDDALDRAELINSLDKRLWDEK